MEDPKLLQMRIDSRGNPFNRSIIGNVDLYKSRIEQSSQKDLHPQDKRQKKAFILERRASDQRSD